MPTLNLGQAYFFAGQWFGPGVVEIEEPTHAATLSRIARSEGHLLPLPDPDDAADNTFSDDSDEKPDDARESAKTPAPASPPVLEASPSISEGETQEADPFEDVSPDAIPADATEVAEPIQEEEPTDETVADQK